MLNLVGFLATTALFVLLVGHEVNRVSAPSVGGSHRPSFRGRMVGRRTEILLWVACAVLLVPRVFDLLT